LNQVKILGVYQKQLIIKVIELILGGIVFFSKSDLIMDWWLKILPIYQHDNKEKHNPDDDKSGMFVLID